MQNSLSSSPMGPTDLEATPTFNVVIAYEDFETGKYAKRTYDYLVENLGHESRFSSQMWKFEVLGIPKLREMAAKDATAADIIIISCHGGNPLPSPVKDWIESWLMEKGIAIALVALFDCDPADSREVRAYLSEVAKRGQMEFFAQPDEWPPKRSQDPLRFHHNSELSEKTLSTLAGVVQRDVQFPRWGINE